MSRPKHNSKDIEAVLRAAEKQDWRVDGGGNRYFKLLCPCVDKHMRWVHLTPSDPNYLKNLTNWLEKKTCWKTS